MIEQVQFVKMINKIMIDKTGSELRAGSIIDLHQTVNGENIFFIKEINPLDIRYRFDIDRKYQYDKEDLLKPDKYTGETEWEIIGNLYDY